MHRLSSPFRFLRSFMASATTRWWPPALPRRFSPSMTSPVFRRIPISSANVPINLSLDNIDERGTILDVITEDDTTDKDACWTTSDVMYIENGTRRQIVKRTWSDEDGKSATEGHNEEIIVSDDEEDVYYVNILEKSRHRDGSMYRGMDTCWKKMFSIADRNETRLQAMALSDPRDFVIDDDGTCIRHIPCFMLQIFSLELTKIPVDDGGIVELYGYIAARDKMDPLLNYVVNISRDEPIIVEQGSLINMTGPKRGIELMDESLIEYDLRIKTGEQEKDDLQLIDGATIISCGSESNLNWPITSRISSDCGAVDLTSACLIGAVEATVDVRISEVQSSFNLSLGCFTSGLKKEIRLFDGAIVESCFLKRSVVAVAWDSLVDLKFRLGSPFSGFDRHFRSFKSKYHGHDTQEIKTDFALISVKVTWSTLPLFCASGVNG